LGIDNLPEYLAKQTTCTWLKSVQLSNPLLTAEKIDLSNLYHSSK